ncbi:multimeric flavodoxin WrbA [Legionella oakridgensis RV-2-2007]|nr:multimeric flavodoxin WrbA [Legionella oakridgensis RV-2-2007]
MNRLLNTRIVYFILFLSFLCQSAMARPLVLISYYSTSSMDVMAQAIAQGVQAVSGVDVKVLPIEKTTFSDVKNAAGVILGSPVYNANAAPQVQQFINTWPLHDPSYKDKVGAVFVIAGEISAGEEATQMDLLRAMMIFNFIIVGGASQHQPFGASAIMDNALIRSDDPPQAVNSEFIKQGEALGQRVAEIVLRLHLTKFSRKTTAIKVI